jgi:predicted transposase/invertase (TIGR01784 family)
MKKLHNPHDKIFRHSLSNIEIAKDFLEIYIPPKILAKFDLKNLMFCNHTYINAQLDEQHADLVYTVKLYANNNSYIYLAIEHQSSSEPLMPFRILKYQLAIMDQHLQQHPQATTLPIVFPILFYHGKETPYPYSLNFSDLFIDQDLTKQTLIKHKPTHLIDITQIPDEEIKKHKIVGLLEFIQKHIYDHDLYLIVAEINQLITNVCNYLNINQGLSLYIEGILQYIINVGNIKSKKAFITALSNNPFIKEHNIMGTLARYFKAEARKEGRAEGKAEGKIEVAKKMLAEGLDLKIIARLTGLSIVTIKNLNKL